jgi:hypothetical protein
MTDIFFNNQKVSKLGITTKPNRTMHLGKGHEIVMELGVTFSISYTNENGEQKTEMFWVKGSPKTETRD